MAVSLLMTVTINGQEVVHFENGELKVDKQVKVLKSEPNFTKLVTSGIKKNIFETSHSSGSYVNLAQKTSVSPSNTISADDWGQIKNVTTGLMENYKANFNLTGTNTNISFKYLDSNFNETKSFTTSIPDSTNDMQVINTLAASPAGKNMLVYLHYFEGGAGPEYQKNEIWVIDQNGQKIKSFEATYASYLKIKNGDTGILTITNGTTTTSFNLYDDHFNLLKTLDIPSNLFSTYAGAPISFLKVKGEDKIVISHYEKKFMNNQTLEVTPDNHLLLKILDLNLSLEKTIPLDISSIYPDEPYTFALGNFGTLPHGHKFEITDKTFNNDADLEIMYAIRYEDLINDKSWVNYYVANEQGQRIKKLEKSIISTSEITPIEGQDDQLGFIIGDGELGSSIDFFNIQSWSDGFSFPASYNGQTLSSYYNRIPNADSYSYLIGLAAGVNINNTSYGVINQYSPSGVLQKDISN